MKYNIRQRRIEKGWKIEEFADMVGTSASHISGIETGKRNPSTDMLESIANVLGVNVNDLYAATEDDVAADAETFRKYSKLNQKNKAAIDILIESLARAEGIQ